MAVNVEFLLAGLPALLLGRKGRVKGGHGLFIGAGVAKGAFVKIPPSAVKNAVLQFLHQQRRRKAIVLKADILFPAALKASGDIVIGISKNDDGLIAHFRGRLE